MSPLLTTLSHFWNKVHGFLFPIIEEDLGPITKKQQQLVSILEMIKIEDFVEKSYYGPGRPPEDRKAIARAFVAKAVYNLPTTRDLIERLNTDATLRRICGWEYQGTVPGEWSFSRAFAEIAASGLANKVHDTLIKETHSDRLVGHISRDATEIEAREKPQPKAEVPQPKTPKHGPGRPKKDEIRVKPEPTRLERQKEMSLDAMIADPPKPTFPFMLPTFFPPRGSRLPGVQNRNSSRFPRAELVCLA